MRRPRMPRPSLPRPRVPRPPSPRRPLAWLGRRLRGVGYLIEDAVYAVARLVRAAGAGVRTFWFSLNIYTRRRLGVAGAAIAVLLLILAVAVPALPCQVPGGDRCAPDDDAIDLVPGDALAYLHANLDPDTDQYEAASELAERLPTIARLAVTSSLSRIPGASGNAAEFQRDVEPWFGGEAALALIPASGGVVEQIQLLEASDEGGAGKYAASLTGGDTTRTRYRGVDVRVDPRGLATTLTGGFLVIGTEQGVHEAIDAESGAGGASSLADSDDAEDALDELPDDRLVDAYLSEDGIAELVARPGALLAQLSPFIHTGASRGAAAALVAGDDDLEVAVRSVLDQKRAKQNPGFFSTLPTFEAGLAGLLPTDSLGYLGVGHPGQALRTLLEQASADEPGLVDAFGALVDQVREVGGVNLTKDLLPSLTGEAAFALQPAPGPGEANEDPLAQARTPFLEFLGSDVDEERAREALARLQAPIANAFGSDALQAPGFAQHKIGDVEAQSLRISPTVNLTYAIFDELLVVATDPAGVAQVAEGDGGLNESDAFEDVTDDFPDESSLLLYLDLDGLVSLAEDAGLAGDPAYATFAQDIRRFDSLGLVVESEQDLLATDARITVSEEEAEPATGESGPAD